MNIFSLIMIICFVIYLSVGIYVYYKDRKAALNRLFLALNLSFAVWAFTAAFMVSSVTLTESIVWNRLGALGYCTFASIALHFLLVYAKKKKILRYWWTYVLLYLPAAGFTLLEFIFDFYTEGYVHKDYGWVLIVNDSSVIFWAYFVYSVLYVMLGLLICALEIKKTSSVRERKQAKVILFSGLATFFVGNIASMYAQFSGYPVIDISSIAIVFWSIGILIGISRYNLMVLTPKVAAEDILQTIIDSLILVSPEGTIISTNKETSRLLGYDSEELSGKPLQILFPEDSHMEDESMRRLLAMCPISNMETTFVTKDHTKIPIIFSASECLDHAGERIGYVVVSRDITKLKNMEERLKHLAHHDSLTNLPNRLLFNDRLNQSIVRAKLNNTYVAVIFLDLDHFKEVNDVLGHDIGDLLLVEVAKRLTDSIKVSDTVVRLGGDEFILLLNDLEQVNDYEETVMTVLKKISRQYLIISHRISITASMGVCVYPVNGTDRESLMKNADLAMYAAKNSGRNNYQIFTPSMSQEAVTKGNLVERLRGVLKNNELLLLYQPVIDMYSGSMLGVEALIYWNHPDYGIMEPSKFMPLVEESNLSITIGEWALRTACSQAVKWQKSGNPPIQISVNLSKKQFRQKDLVDNILQILDETGLDPKHLFLEINESTILHDMTWTTETLKRIFDHGIMTILDDFGTGYSSLVYLRKLPFYAIKIDRFFVTDIANDPECAVIVSAIVTMAHNLKFKVFAEGIENNGQFESLRSLDGQLNGSAICDGAQGYLFSYPVNEETITDLFEKQEKGRTFF